MSKEFVATADYSDQTWLEPGLTLDSAHAGAFLLTPDTSAWGMALLLPMHGHLMNFGMDARGQH